MSSKTKTFLTVIITFFATLALVFCVEFAYIHWFDYSSDILVGNDVEVVHGGAKLSFCDTLCASDLSAVDSILSGAGISYKLGERDALVLVRGCDEKRAVRALVDSGYDFEGCLGSVYL